MRLSLNNVPGASLLALLLACSTPTSPAPTGDSPACVERRLALMGTGLELWVEAADRATALAASEGAVRALEAAEARLSTWRTDSELAALNRAPAGRFHPLSPALRADLAAALDWCAATGGAFDPLCGSLVRAWDLRGGGRQPSAGELEQARALADPALLVLSADGACRRQAGATVEEGGFGKGRGLDEALAALRAAGAARATLDLGGQQSFLGPGPFRVEVADPRERARPAVILELDGGSFATSGNSERGLVIGGRRLGHLLDPRTGTPAPDFGSLGVWAPDATAADCLSTGLYVLGPDAALAWAEEHPGIEVLILETLPAGLRVRASSGLRDRLHPVPN